MQQCYQLETTKTLVIFPLLNINLGVKTQTIREIKNKSTFYLFTLLHIKFYNAQLQISSNIRYKFKKIKE